MEAMIQKQMDVLNASFSGTTAADAADTPFRFTLDRVNWVVNPSGTPSRPGRPSGT